MPQEAVNAASLDVVDNINAFAWMQKPIEEGIGLALSGGGFRAALFHAGAVVRLNELGLLSQIKRISSVSGGSITSALLAMQWQSYGPPDGNGVLPSLAGILLPKILDFAKLRLDAIDIATGLLPFTTAAKQISASYDRHLFHGMTLADLPDAPEFVFCATNLSTGVLWRFTRDYAGDYIVGYIPSPTIKMADVVAASAAFPPFLSPVVLDVQASQFKDWPSRPQELVADRTPFRERIVLCDGGVYDNHGVEPIVKRLSTNLVSDGGAPFSRQPVEHLDWLSQLRRVVDIEDNQVRALRRRDLIARFTRGKALGAAGVLTPEQLVTGARFGAYWGIDTDPTRFALADQLVVPADWPETLSALPTRLSDLGADNNHDLVNWGYAIADRCIRKHLVPAAKGEPPNWPL